MLHLSRVLRLLGGLHRFLCFRQPRLGVGLHVRIGLSLPVCDLRPLELGPGSRVLV